MNDDPNTWIEEITFNRISIAEVLTQLAKKLNYFWYVDYDRDLHFFRKNREEAPFELTDTSENFIYDSLKVTTDFSQIRNKIIVRGGEAESNERTQLLSGTGESKAFPLAYKFADKPVVLVNDVEQTVGVNGFDADEDVDVLWDFNQKSLEFNDSSIPPSGVDNVEVTGIPLLPVLVYVNDLESQGLYGRTEHVVEDKRLISRTDAIAFGKAELEAYSRPLNSVEFSTYTQGLRSGQTIRVNCPSREIDDYVLIDKVVTVLDSDTRPVWKVSATSYRTSKFLQIMQELFRSNKVDINSLERLFGIQERSDQITIEDSIEIEALEGPYYYQPATGSNTPGVWGLSKWG